MRRRERKFNTAGPMKPELHYTIPPLERWETDDILGLIDDMKYFVLHAPRQTGKTSCLLALRDLLNKGDDYHCVYANVEAAQTARNDVESGMGIILSEFDNAFQVSLGLNEKPFSHKEILSDSEPGNAINSYLRVWRRHLERPLVLLIDEIDALIGDVLVSVLRQLRSGYADRPANFPQSVVLCGVRDVRDYRIHRADGEVITGGSAFNIKSESLSLGPFSEREVRALYGQHTEETGQIFEEAVFPKVMELTGGQPWLVNALAYEAAFDARGNRDRSKPITPDSIDEAKERLILSRATHLDQLADKLKEERVRKVVEPMLAGENPDTSREDLEYCVDLGLIRFEDGTHRVANAIYREVLPRELTESTQRRFVAEFKPEWVNPDGSLNADRLLEMFSLFWRANGEIWTRDISGYKEAAPLLVFQGFLQRVANGNGMVEREYALGSKRVDLALKWRSDAGEQRIAIELKTLRERDSYDSLVVDALRQTADYAERYAATEAHVVVFDRAGKKPEWRSGDEVFTEIREFRGWRIKIWGL